MQTTLMLNKKEHHYLHLARTKYKNDWAVQTWLRIYERGTVAIKTKKGKIEGIAPKSPYILKNLVEAIRLREERKVWSVVVMGEQTKR